MILPSAWDRAAGWITALLLVLFVVPNAALGQAADDLAWVPADGPGFVRLRFADLWKHEVVKEFREAFAKAYFGIDLDRYSEIGVSAREIERMILLMPRGRWEPVYVLTTAKPALEQMLKGETRSKKKHKEQTYYENQNEGEALYPAGERLFVIGPTKGVLELLDRAAEKKANSPLGEALKLATGKAPLVACINLTVLAKELKGALPPQAEAALPLLEANPALLTVVSDADTQITAHLTCASDEDAKKKAQTLRVTLDILRQLVPVGRTELARKPMPNELQKWTFKQADNFLVDLQDACKTATIEAKGRVVHGQMRLKSNAASLMTLALGFSFSS